MERWKKEWQRKIFLLGHWTSTSQNNVMGVSPKILYRVEKKCGKRTQKTSYFQQNFEQNFYSVFNEVLTFITPQTKK